MLAAHLSIHCAKLATSRSSLTCQVRSDPRTAQSADFSPDWMEFNFAATDNSL
jgi:hypothetical protein